MPTSGESREDGKVFIRYNPQCTNGEWWGTRKQLEKLRSRDMLKQRKSRIEKRETIKAQRRARYLKDRKKILQRNRNYVLRNPDKIARAKLAYYNMVSKTPLYRKKIREKQARYLREDPLNRAILNSRTRIGSFLKYKGMLKRSKTLDMLGCNKDELRAWIASGFQTGMSWENYGEWHIDHIVPLSIANSPDDVYLLCHFTNLQPLWAKDNSAKHDKTPFANRDESIRFVKEARLALQKEAIPVYSSEVVKEKYSPEVVVNITPVATGNIQEAK